MAAYKRVSCFLVVENDDAESTIEQLNVALDAIGERTTVYDSAIDETTAEEPANAAEIKNGN